MKYLIWSIEHQGWWKQDRYGYTFNISEAGRFNKGEAEKILKQANIVKTEEVMIPVERIQVKVDFSWVMFTELY